MDPFISGKRNAEVILEEHGYDWAIDWLLDRLTNTSKAPLHARYVEGYRVALQEYRKTRG